MSRRRTSRLMLGRRGITRITGRDPPGFRGYARTGLRRLAARVGDRVVDARGLVEPGAPYIGDRQADRRARDGDQGLHELRVVPAGNVQPVDDEAEDGSAQ